MPIAPRTEAGLLETIAAGPHVLAARHALLAYTLRSGERVRGIARLRQT
ncbi:hypothetical protein U1707_17800 [Sphingomonas sp. PB2P12]